MELTSLFFSARKVNVEAGFLARIIRIDIAKIRLYLKDLRAVKSVFDEPVSTVKARIMAFSNSGPALEEFSGMV